MFIGPEGIGKKTISLIFASLILCTDKKDNKIIERIEYLEQRISQLELLLGIKKSGKTESGMDLTER